VTEDEVGVVVEDDGDTAVGVLVDVDGRELDELVGGDGGEDGGLLVDVDSLLLSVVGLVCTGGGYDGGELDGVDVEELVGNDEDGGVLVDVVVGLLLGELALCIILIALLRN